MDPCRIDRQNQPEAWWRTRLAARTTTTTLLLAIPAWALAAEDPRAVLERIAPVARVEIARPDAAPSAPAAPPPPAAAPAATPAPAAAAAPPAAVPTASVPAAAAKDPTAEVRGLIERWARAWSERDVAGYLDAYGTDFKPEGGTSRAAWEDSRRKKIGSRKNISVTIRKLEIESSGENRMAARFVQDYQADAYQESGVAKSLLLAREDGGWRIVAETVAAAGR